MGGFPGRISRNAFGPVPKNRYPVTDPSKQMGADIGDLLFWQLSGLNMAAPRASLLIDGASATVLFCGMAWDPNQSQLAPSVARTGAGVYVVTFLASYPDKDGNPAPTALVAARAAAQGAAGAPMPAGAKVRVDLRTVDVNVVTMGNVATDAPFWLEVL